MRKIMTIGVFAAVLASAVTVCSGAAPAKNAGNETCPVLGSKINPAKKVTYTYKGTTYNLCCKCCIDEFKKDPEKYIKTLNRAAKPKDKSKPAK